MSQAIQICLRFSPERIHIENYWIKPENFRVGRTVYRRNPLIADMFGRIEYGERLGTGFQRMREECNKADAPLPRIEAGENYFYVTFNKSRAYIELAGRMETTPKTTPKINYEPPPKEAQELTGLERLIFEEIIKDTGASKERIAVRAGKSINTVKEYIRKLRKKGIVKWIGSSKAGHWEILIKK